MKKVVYILSLAALMTLMACNSENGASSKSVDADGKMIKTETSVSESVSQSETVSTPDADQPGDNQVKASQPKPGQAPFSAEDAVKYSGEMPKDRTFTARRKRKKAPGTR